MTQPSLFDPVEHPLRRAYELFLADNGWVLTRLAHMALDLKQRGYRHYGIAALVEVIRYEHAKTNDPSTDWKLNNNYRAFLARDLMALYPDLDGFFETRRSIADDL